MRALLFVVVAYAGLSSCASMPLACTEIGCTDTIVLEVIDSAGAPVTAFRGTVIADGRTIAFDCSSPSASNPDAFCDGQTVRVQAPPPSGSIHVTIESPPGTNRFDDDVTLGDRQVTQPNGPGCPPECTTAKAAIQLQ